MVQVIVRHKVEDYHAWKDVFDAFTPVRKASGEISFHVMRTINNPSELTLLFQWDNLTNAESYMKSSVLKNAMKDAGVIGEVEIFYLEEVARGKTKTIARNGG